MTYRIPPETIIRMAVLRLAGRSYTSIGAQLRREGLHMGCDDETAGEVIQRRLERIVKTRKRPRYPTYSQAERKCEPQECRV